MSAINWVSFPFVGPIVIDKNIDKEEEQRMAKEENPKLSPFFVITCPLNETLSMCMRVSRKIKSMNKNGIEQWIKSFFNPKEQPDFLINISIHQFDSAHFNLKDF